MSDTRPLELGLRENLAQFSLLVTVTAFVGAMVGLERSSLPVLGRAEFSVTSAAAILLFIVAFGLAKAFTNLAAGGLVARIGRKRLLTIGWLLAFPVPALIAWAPSWGWIIVANLFLGVNQGLTWSMAVLMKIDLVGPLRRGFALGLNEAAGYGGVALAAFAIGILASSAPRSALAIGGLLIAMCATLITVFLIRDTGEHVALEQSQHDPEDQQTPLTLKQAFSEATVKRPALRSCSQAGFVNNLNDALAWGVVPLFLALHGASLTQIGLVAAIYPAVWGIGQIGTGHLSDVVGRKPLIVAGMFTQALALGILGASNGNIAVASCSALLLGIGTALVYPTLIAAISDNVSPVDRAPVVGTYRFWRDMGYVAGAILAGVSADALGYPAAIGIVAVVTALSGVWFLFDFPKVTT